MSFLTKKKSVSSTSSVSSAGSQSSSNYTTSTNNKNTFTKFDEKKDYVRRCSIKNAKDKHRPCSVTFCLGKQ